MEYLKVPFAYEADILPSRRHKNTRHTRLRSEILVDLPDLGRAEFDEVAELPALQSICGWARNINGDRTLLARNGAFFAPFRVNGKAVGLQGTIDALAEPEVLASGHLKWSPLLFSEMHDYPIVTSPNWRFSPTPLMLKSFGTHCAFEGWPGATMVAADLNDRELDAAKHLDGAFALIDGIVYMRRREPVWHVLHVGGRQYQITVETAPWANGAPNFFRLDKKREALAWAASRHFHLLPEDTGAPLTLFRPDKLERFDALQVAAGVLATWPGLRDDHDPAHEALYGRGGDAEVLDTLHDGKFEMDIAQAMLVMDALREVMIVAGAPPRWSTFRAALARWRAEGPGREADLLTQKDTNLSDDDLAALVGL